MILDDDQLSELFVQQHFRNKIKNFKSFIFYGRVEVQEGCENKIV